MREPNEDEVKALAFAEKVADKARIRTERTHGSVIADQFHQRIMDSAYKGLYSLLSGETDNIGIIKNYACLIASRAPRHLRGETIPMSYLEVNQEPSANDRYPSDESDGVIGIMSCLNDSEKVMATMVADGYRRDEAGKLFGLTRRHSWLAFDRMKFILNESGYKC